METVAIHQPCYIPYLGIFYKIWLSDIFVYLDDAQYSNGYVFDWNRIKTPQGECRLKVPTQKSFGQKLNEITPKDFLGWKDKHLKTIMMNYKKARYFDEVFSDFRDCLLSSHSTLADLNISTMNLFITKFNWNKKILRTSEIGITSMAEERVIEIVKKVGGDIYFSGNGGKNYQNESHFLREGINLVYPDFHAFPYSQLWGDFLPNMSVLDFCMNEGYNVEKFFNKLLEGTKNEQ